MTDLAKEELPAGGQLLLLFSAGLFFLAVGVWFLTNATKPGVVNKMRSLSDFSPRGEKETQILARILGVGFAIGGAAAFIGGGVVAFR
ncbi:hypothetical protein K4749_17005 [Streptomyces sp. TRM72054]|uniref:hypothetical protein n=1 Tax=Streptomyces sp. TRM72054 TaxID=2870562 RepID=UPI001C8C19B7|nr:hypothetical protein [Streptomyces sp. TRM72054]MBX9395248.1 hypothetical protein [Streptomyces sp. TRM72054]